MSDDEGWSDFWWGARRGFILGNAAVACVLVAWWVVTR